MLHYTGRDHSVKMWNGGLERAKLVSAIHNYNYVIHMMVYEDN